MKKHVLPLLLLFTTASAMQQQAVVLTPDTIATFKALQEIRRITILVAQHYKEVCELTVPTDPQPNPKQGQTKEGLEMLVRDYPRFLKTPWGLFPLYSSATHSYANGCQALKEKLLQNITLNSNETLFSWPYEKNDVTLKPSKRPQTNVPTGASQKEIYNRHLNENPGFAYGIQTVKTEFESITCPRAISCPEELYRNDEEVMTEWQALEELAKNNYRRATPRSTKSSKAPKTSPKALVTLPLLAILPTTAPSDPTSPKSPAPQKTLTEQNKKTFASPTSPVLTRPCSPHDQESSTLRTHTEQKKNSPLSPPATTKKSEPTCSSMYRF